jgi:Ca-activated chloride channel family protein
MHAVFKNLRAFRGVICLAILLLSACQRQSTEEVETTLGPRAVTLQIVHSPELRHYFSTIKELFAAQNTQLSDGTLVGLNAIEEPGLSAAHKISSGEIKADAWLAPSTSLINFTNSHIKNLGARQSQCIQLFSTPVVFAAGRDHADNFPGQAQKVSWATLAETKLAGSNGLDDAQAIMFSHATPKSASGLSALLQLAFLSSSASERALSVDALEAPSANDKFARFQAHISHYADLDSVLLDKVATSGTKRIRFAITTEQQVATYNAAKHDQSGPPLIALYPEEGSVWQDYSFCHSEADWVNPAKRAALGIFSQFLASDAAQLEAKKSGFRPTRAVLPETAPLLPANGIKTSLPERSMLPVSGDVITYVLKTWDKFVRPSATVILLDASGSMEGNALTASREALRIFLAGLAPHEKAGLVAISSQPQGMAPVGLDMPTLMAKLDAVEAQGGSALYDSLKVAIDELIEPRFKASRKNIVLITDGDDKSSELTLQGALNYVSDKLIRHDMNLSIVLLNSAGAGGTDLQRIAKAANGTFKEVNLDELPKALEAAFRN